MKKILLLLAFAAGTFLMPTAAQAQANVPTSDILESLQEDGRYVEGVLSSADSAAIDEANSQGLTFVWLDQPFRSDNEAPDLADELRTDLRLRGSEFTDVVVLIDDRAGSTIGLGAASNTATNTQVDAAVTASSQQFLQGDIGAGLTQYVQTINGLGTADQSTSSDATTGSSGGIGLFGLVLIIALLGGGLFLAYKVVGGRRKAKKTAINDMEADRQEIAEQLKNNADRVISLGDEVILNKDDELIQLYEEASGAYQEVSSSLANAATPDAVDQLDDKIDKAEWQFDVIEAKLAGEPAPPSPAEREEQRQREFRSTQGRGPQDQASTDRPALGADESVFSGRPAQQPQQRRSSGGLGGAGMGGGLGGALGSILMGGSLGGRRSSRRTQRRRIGGNPSRGSGGFSDPFGGSRRRSRGSSGGRGGGGFSRGGRGGGGFRR